VNLLEFKGRGEPSFGYEYYYSTNVMNDKYLNAIYILFWTFLSKKEPLFCVGVPKKRKRPCSATPRCAFEAKTALPKKQQKQQGGTDDENAGRKKPAKEHCKRYPCR
jgi:hypothetical protein